MVEEYLDKAAPCILNLLPMGWEQVVIYVEIDSLHYNIFFYVKHNKKYCQCYNLSSICNVTESEIDSAFETWYIIAVNNKKEEQWNSYTLTINSDGKFQVEYNYRDEFELDLWKKRYLV